MKAPPATSAAALASAGSTPAPLPSSALPSTAAIVLQRPRAAVRIAKAEANKAAERDTDPNPDAHIAEPRLLESGATSEDDAESAEEVDTSDLCLWAVSISLTHPSTGELMTFSIDEPPLFNAVRGREFEAWRAA